MCTGSPTEALFVSETQVLQCRRSRFLKKHSHGHWLAEGGQNSDHDLSRYEPWYLPPRLVRSWLCSHGREPYMNRSDVCPGVDSKSD